MQAPTQLAMFTDRVYFAPLAGKNRLLARLLQDCRLADEAADKIEAAEWAIVYDEADWEDLCNEQARLLVCVTEGWARIAPLARTWWTA